MSFGRHISALAGIALVLFIGIASHFGSLQRAETQGTLQTLSALGLTADDFCGGMPHGHSDCPLCRLEDSAITPDRMVLAGECLPKSQTRTYQSAWKLPKAPSAFGQPRAPPRHV